MAFNILRFESPPAHDPVAERAIMGASAITPAFDRLGTTAAAIFAQVCPDEIVAATRVKDAMISMISRGAWKGRMRVSPCASSTLPL